MPNKSNVIITADSTCDLPQNLIDKYDIKIIPLTILLGDKEYLDGVDVTPEDIYKFVDETGVLPKTSAVPPARYYEIFEQATKNGNKVVHIGLSSAISSSFSNARMSAEDFEDVYCVDSKSLCTAMGLLVLKACDYREKGMDAKKIADRINKLVPKVSATFIVNSLDYLHKGGRCSATAKFGANVLGIKPSISVDSTTGTMDVAKKYRGKMELVYKQYINDCLNEKVRFDSSRVVIANSGQLSPETLAFAEGLIEGKGIFDEIIKADAGCTISSHCGPKTLAIFYIKK